MSNLIPSTQEMNEIVSICKILASSPFYQKMGPGGVLGVWLTARELNLPVMQCLNGGLYTFDGKVTMSAQLMNMMIVKAGHEVEFIHLDDHYCELKLIRKDRTNNNTLQNKFTIEMAGKAGLLSKDAWKKNPKDMLFARCLSQAARKLMPDVLGTIYVAGELSDDNFKDDHIVNIAPEIESKFETPQITIQECKPIFEESKDYKDFCEKHHLVLNENIPDTIKENI